jgi:hypothetical protein
MNAAKHHNQSQPRLYPPDFEVEAVYFSVFHENRNRKTDLSNTFASVAKLRINGGRGQKPSLSIDFPETKSIRPMAEMQSIELLGPSVERGNESCGCLLSAQFWSCSNL